MRELSLHLLDLLENARTAGAKQVEVHINEDLATDQLTIFVRDDGQGMDAEMAQRATDPFFTTRTTRRVGLGLPLLAAAAQQCGGALCLESAPGEGTAVTAAFQHSHIDRAPLGKIVDTLLAFLLGECPSGATQSPRLVYRHQVDSKSFELDTAVIQAEVGDVPLSYPPLRKWLRRYLTEGEAALVSDSTGRSSLRKS
jgi:hypothetical protein